MTLGLSLGFLALTDSYSRTDQGRISHHCRIALKRQKPFCPSARNLKIKRTTAVCIPVDGPTRRKWRRLIRGRGRRARRWCSVPSLAGHRGWSIRGLRTVKAGWGAITCGWWGLTVWLRRGRIAIWSLLCRRGSVPVRLSWWWRRWIARLTIWAWRWGGTVTSSLTRVAVAG